MKLLRRHHLVLLLLGLAALIAASCGDDGGDQTAPDGEARGAVTVGSADFAESEIVAAMYALTLEEAGYDVSRQFGIGARDVYFPALEAGEIDLVPEFVGTLVTFLGGEASSDADESVSALEEVLPPGLVALEAAEGESTNVFVVTQETAEEHGLDAVSDLAGVAGELTLGGPPECPERPFCIPGLRDVYGVEFGQFRPLDAGGPITRQALQSGEVDVALLFSTDGNIAANDWVVLEDDRDLQQAENVIPVAREEVVDDTFRQRVNAVQDALGQDAFLELNRRVGVDNEDPEDVARRFLEEEGVLDGA